MPRSNQEDGIFQTMELVCELIFHDCRCRKRKHGMEHFMNKNTYNDMWNSVCERKKDQQENGSLPRCILRNTGDSASDDPLNQNETGRDEILVCSFGTCFNDSRVRDIHAIENAVQKAFPDMSVRRAFTSDIIITHLFKRDGEKIDSITEALERACDNGVENLIILPTHLMHGIEYDKIAGAVDDFRKSRARINITIAEPLLGKTGRSGKEFNEDESCVSKALSSDIAKTAGYASPEEAAAHGTAFVLMGHGTSHESNIVYEQMQTAIDAFGYVNVFTGTVEGKPEGTDCRSIIRSVQMSGFKKVILRPLMVVAGNHAYNDMADENDPSSWVSLFRNAGFGSVSTQLKGLGRLAAIQYLYIKHAKEAAGNLSGF